MHPGAIINSWRISPPTPEAAAAIEPPCYTPEWFAWVRVHKPEIAQLYMLGSDEDGLYDDQADDQGDDQADEDDQEAIITEEELSDARVEDRVWEEGDNR
jgi:hypothetical protein